MDTFVDDFIAMRPGTRGCAVASYFDSTISKASALGRTGGIESAELERAVACVLFHHSGCLLQVASLATSIMAANPQPIDCSPTISMLYRLSLNKFRRWATQLRQTHLQSDPDLQLSVNAVMTLDVSCISLQSIS